MTAESTMKITKISTPRKLPAIRYILFHFVIKIFVHTDTSSLERYQMDKPALKNYLPPGFTLCHPEIVGLGAGSLKLPAGYTILLHYSEMSEHFHTIYMLAHADVPTNGSTLLNIYIIKHHLTEGWYFADGLLISSDNAHVTRFLHNAAYTKRTQSIEEMNNIVKKMIPAMLRKNGIPSIQLFTHFTTYMR